MGAFGYDWCCGGRLKGGGEGANVVRQSIVGRCCEVQDHVQESKLLSRSEDPGDVGREGL